MFIFLREFNIFNKKSLELAEKLFRERKLSRAKKILLCLIKNKNLKKSSEAMFFLGKIYYFEKNYNKAKKIFKKLYNVKCEENIIRLKALYSLALIAEKEEESDLAIKYLIRFQEDKENFMSSESISFEKEVFMILSKCYFNKGEEQKATEYSKKYLSEKLNKNEEVIIKRQLGKFYLELANYEEAEKYFKEIEEKISVKLEKTHLNYYFAMIFLGKKDYKSLFVMTTKEDFLQGGIKSLFFGLYSSAMLNIEEKNFEKGKESLDKIFESIIRNLDVDNFYEFYYYTVLGYYGRASLELARNNFGLAEEYLRKVEVIFEKISNVDMEFSSFIQRVNISFLKILIFSELANIYYLKKDIKKTKYEIKKANYLIESLTLQERMIVGRKEFGNKGSVIEKINVLKSKLNEKN